MNKDYNEIILSFGQQQVKFFINNLEPTYLLFLMAELNEKSKFRILQNISRISFKNALQKLGEILGSYRSEWDEQATNFFSALYELPTLHNINDFEIAIEKATVAARKKKPSKPVRLNHKNPKDIKDFIMLVGEIIEKASNDGFASLEKEGKTINNELVENSLNAVLNAESSINIDGMLDSIITKHLEQEKIKCKIVKKAFIELFGSSDSKALMYEISNMVPFLK